MLPESDQFKDIETQSRLRSMLQEKVNLGIVQPTAKLITEFCRNSLSSTVFSRNSGRTMVDDGEEKTKTGEARKLLSELYIVVTTLKGSDSDTSNPKTQVSALARFEAEYKGFTYYLTKIGHRWNNQIQIAGIALNAGDFQLDDPNSEKKYNTFPLFARRGFVSRLGVSSLTTQSMTLAKFVMGKDPYNTDDFKYARHEGMGKIYGNIIRVEICSLPTEVIWVTNVNVTGAEKNPEKITRNAFDELDQALMGPALRNLVGGK